eukprot:jgi/Chrzof1/15048/Cz09g25070.t1
MKFTCLRCGATNIKPVSPHAWAEGSVFARCAKCKVIHKVVDNLNIFHELAGPVFNNPVPLPDDFNQQLPERFRLSFDGESGDDYKE